MLSYEPDTQNLRGSIITAYGELQTKVIFNRAAVAIKADQISEPSESTMWQNALEGRPAGVNSPPLQVESARIYSKL